MSSSQKKAVERHRRRQLKNGIVRMEINVPKADREMLRKAAAKLRAGGQVAERIRAVLDSILNPFDGLTLKELLESAPLEGVDLERSRETARDIDL